MTKTYITNATWALTGERIDLCPDNAGVTSALVSGAPTPYAAPAGQLPIPTGAMNVVDATGKFLLPALFDLHTHIDLPGRSKRESIIRAGQAAKNGGVWGMLVMPSRMFPFDNTPALDSFYEMVDIRSAAEMVAAGCISQGMEGAQQAPYNTLAARGVTILSDGGHYPTSLLMLHRAMKYAAELGLTFALRGDLPALSGNTCIHPGVTSYRLGLHGTPPCAEEIGIETLLRLAEDAGAKLHLQTVSTARGVESIRRAKERGQAVTAEVALHHLLYTHEDVGEYDTNYKVQPPLREKADTEALIAAVKDGVIDCIVTDHTPCTPFSKKQDFTSAPQGTVGLDTFLPAVYTYLVAPGKLSWAEAIRACCITPARIACPQAEEGGAEAPLILFDPEPSFTVTPAHLACGTLNTPLLGQTLRGAMLHPLS